MTGRACAGVCSGERQTPKCNPGTSMERSTSTQTRRRTPCCLALAGDLRDMLHAIYHQRDRRATSHSVGDGADVVRMPGGIADEQISEPLRRQPDRLTGGEAHDTLEAWIGGEDAPQDRDAAQRLRGQSHLLVTRPMQDLLDILVEQIEIDIGERHRMLRKDPLVIGIIALHGFPLSMHDSEDE